MPKAAREGSFSRLVIFTHGDFTSMENGSHLRMAEQIGFAGQRFAHVAVYSYRQHPSHPWNPAGEARFRRGFPDIALILEDAPRRLRWSIRIKNIALALLPGAAPLTLKATVRVSRVARPDRGLCRVVSAQRPRRTRVDPAAGTAGLCGQARRISS
jgi:hypothetical protein